MQVGWRTGFCGSLTTFASWKLQMVQMLLAGKGSYYGSQWLGAGMGLILGTMAGMSSLMMGQHVALMLLKRHRSKNTTANQLHQHPISFTPFTVSMCSLLVLSTAAAVFGVCWDTKVRFWRKFAAAVLLAPLGALARWQLSALNGTLPTPWLPIGTLCANLLACAISFASQGVDTRWSNLHSIYQLLLYALRTGLAGSLSTVSTWVVEVRPVYALPFLLGCIPGLIDSEARVACRDGDQGLRLRSAESRIVYSVGRRDLRVLSLDLTRRH